MLWWPWSIGTASRERPPPKKAWKARYRRQAPRRGVIGICARRLPDPRVGVGSYVGQNTYVTSLQDITEQVGQRLDLEHYPRHLEVEVIITYRIDRGADALWSTDYKLRPCKDPVSCKDPV